jgi:hypothetical protein
MQLNQLQGLVIHADIHVPLVLPKWHVNRTIDFDVPITGEFVLEHVLELDPNASVWSYVAILAGYAAAIVFAGYWVVKRQLVRKTG